MVRFLCRDKFADRCGDGNRFVLPNNSIMADGGKINLQGFGTFESPERKARIGRNPRTGDAIDIMATTVPAFSASKHFKDQVREAPMRVVLVLFFGEGWGNFK